MPFLPVELLAPSLTPDNVGASVLAPVPDPAPDPGLLDPVPDPSLDGGRWRGGHERLRHQRPTRRAGRFIAGVAAVAGIPPVLAGPSRSEAGGGLICPVAVDARSADRDAARRARAGRQGLRTEHRERDRPRRSGPSRQRRGDRGCRDRAAGHPSQRAARREGRCDLGHDACLCHARPTRRGGRFIAGIAAVAGIPPVVAGAGRGEAGRRLVGPVAVAARRADRGAARRTRAGRQRTAGRTR